MMHIGPSNSIIIVAPDKYARVARSIVHQISKNFVTNGFDAGYWTIKHFKDNECVLQGSQRVIFIGDESENEYSSIYLPHIQLNNNHGICYGYDGPKAVVYGEGKLEQIADLKKEVQKIRELTPLEDGIATVMTYLAFIVVGPPWIVYDLIGEARAKKRLKKEQTRVAAYSFCQNELEKWMNE